MNKLEGKKIAEILWSEYVVVFVTDEGEKFPYEVEGDCCSHSYLFDFYGVKNLLNNGPVLGFAEYDLQEGDPGFHECDYENSSYTCVNCDSESLQVYGFSLTTEHPVWGLMTSVLSFRNESNGYYGGWMEATKWESVKHLEFEKLTEDKIGWPETNYPRSSGTKRTTKPQRAKRKTSGGAVVGWRDVTAQGPLRQKPFAPITEPSGLPWVLDNAPPVP